MNDSINGSPAPASPKLTIVVAFLAIYLIWGTTFLGIRIAVETIPPFLMAGLRFFVAGGVMLLIALVRGGRMPTPRQWRSAAVVGGLMLLGGIGLLSASERRLPSGFAALVVTTIPLWMALFEWVAFRGKRPNLQTTIGLALGFAGAVLLFLPALDSAGTYDLPSIGMVLIGAMIFAIGSLYSRRAPLPADTWISTASEMFAGGVLLLLVSAIIGEPFRLHPASISTRSIVALAYLAVVGSIIGYTAYLWLLKRVEPAKVGTNFYVNPVIAVIVGAVIAGEHVTRAMILAAVVILFGVAVINVTLPRGGRTRQAEVAMQTESSATD